MLRYCHHQPTSGRFIIKVRSDALVVEYKYPAATSQPNDPVDQSILDSFALLQQQPSIEFCFFL